MALRLNFILTAASQTFVRWMLVKRPDGETNLASTSLIDATFHGSDDTINARELRKYTVAKGMVVIPSDRLATRMPIFVSRKALARISPLRENDRLTLHLAKSAAGTTVDLDGFGTIWVKANA